MSGPREPCCAWQQPTATTSRTRTTSGASVNSKTLANAITADVLKYRTRTLSCVSNRTSRSELCRIPTASNLCWMSSRIESGTTGTSCRYHFRALSATFQWFFSFLAAFSEYRFSKDSVILLLTSPLWDSMRGPKRLPEIHRRTTWDEKTGALHDALAVSNPDGKPRPSSDSKDKGQDTGTIVSANVTSTDPDTLFPLQGALGYDLVQSLFIAPHNLVVEGTSDFTYLVVLSDHLKSCGTDLSR